MRPGILLGLPLIALTACAATTQTTAATETAMPPGRAGQEQACAGEYAASLDRPISAILVRDRGSAPSGNDVVFLETADTVSTAACEVDEDGAVVSIMPLF